MNDADSSGRAAGAVAAIPEAGAPLVHVDAPRLVGNFSFTPNYVMRLPRPTPAEEALRARPNVWEHPAIPPPAVRESGRSSRAQPPRPINGVRDGAPSHLQIVAEIILEEWAAVPPALMANCWAKACILPLEMEARVIADHGD